RAAAARGAAAGGGGGGGGGDRADPGAQGPARRAPPGRGDGGRAQGARGRLARRHAGVSPPTSGAAFGRNTSQSAAPSTATSNEAMSAPQSMAGGKRLSAMLETSLGRATPPIIAALVKR